VYGIVKQNHGWIGIETKPGAGTSFRIYLPGIAAQPSAIGAGNLRRPTLNGLETVLVVEDQADVRRLATGILHAHNYTVLEAPDATTAIDLAERHPSPIHLLLTDVVLPGMNGRELAERLRVQRPEIKILYTSGYTRDVIAHRGVLDREVCFIPKPYSPEALAAKVREVLGTRPEREA
jgi:CheY-like chemotaxis protein